MTRDAASPFPADLDLQAVSRWPTVLAPSTIDAVLAAPLPECRSPIAEPVCASIVVPTLNNLVYNRLCLETLLAHTERPAYEVIVVDNGSVDGTRDYLGRLSEAIPCVRTILNAHNRGFGVATNQGLAAARGRRLVMLNNDALVPPGWLERLLPHLDDPAIGLVGPVTNRCGNEAEIETSYRSYGEFLEFARSRRADDPSFEIRMLAMFCAATTREVYERIGPLDERFEVGLFEDDDYCMRLRAAGYGVRCVPSVFVHHFGQASIGKLAADGAYGTLFHANRLRWEQKWGTRWLAHARRPSRNYLDMTARIRRVVGASLPADARILVVSKGAPALLDLSGRVARHFPETDAGEYAGHHPPDDAAAIEHLEAARQTGADFLLIPSVSRWWLDHYREFARHLRTKYTTVFDEEATCVIFSLRQQPAAASAERIAEGARRGTLVLAGSLAQRPGKGGHAWVFLQYLLGFKRLGWDVLFLDRLDPDMCVDEAGNRCPVDASVNLRYLVRVLERFGLADSFALACDRGKRMIGLSRAEVCERVKRSAVFLNVMGFFADEQILGCSPRRVFLDIDPGFGQMWRALGLADVFTGHDAYVTIGENLGRSDCAIPTCGLDWIATRPPVVLPSWPVTAAVRPGLSSIASWRGPFGPIEYRGKTYGLRVHEFRRFASLPRLCGQPFRLALDIHPQETKDLSLLTDEGWQLDDPLAAAGEPWAYQAYIQQSWAELMIAKHLYVATRSGWFSDRSVCYLASGKPVVCQDTGLREIYPTGEGLLLFSTVDEARAAVAEVTGNYAKHARAARMLAEEFFDSDKVLRGLLARLGVDGS